MDKGIGSLGQSRNLSTNAYKGTAGIGLKTEHKYLYHENSRVNPTQTNRLGQRNG